MNRKYADRTASNHLLSLDQDQVSAETGSAHSLGKLRVLFKCIWNNALVMTEITPRNIINIVRILSSF